MHFVLERCLHENCVQMIEIEQQLPNNSPNLNGIEILYMGSDA